MRRRHLWPILLRRYLHLCYCDGRSLRYGPLLVLVFRNLEHSGYTLRLHFYHLLILSSTKGSLNLWVYPAAPV